MFSNSELESFLRVVTYPRNKREGFLAETVQLLGDGAAERIVNDLSSLTKQDISRYAVANFNALDRYPNPRDQLISDSELVDALQNSTHRMEQAILVAMWLRFEEIKNTHVDATGMDVVYDTQLSYWDLAKYGEVQDGGMHYAEAQPKAQYTQQQQLQYSEMQNAEAQYNEALYAQAQQTESHEAQMDQIFVQQQSTQKLPRESVSSKVTLHTIYGDNIIGGYFD